MKRQSVLMQQTCVPSSWRSYGADIDGGSSALMLEASHVLIT